MSQKRQSWRVGGRDPQILSWGSCGWGRREGRGRVWENTMSYFGLKVCWKVIIFQKKEKKFGMNVGLNGSFL